jgi:hypothetical protein
MGMDPLVIEAADGGALFGPERRLGDFSLEFWLYPLHMENGETVLTWTAENGGVQRIQCAAVKNRLQWTFTGFFASPDGTGYLDLSFAGSVPVVPRVWAHHLLRFEADTGLLEYLVNGRSEAIIYASSSGGEGGDVYTPLTGRGGAFAAGSRFSGLMDEFIIRGGVGETPALHKYAGKGRLETAVFDLGEGNSGVVRVEAAGGRTGTGGNIYGGGGFSYPDNSAITFFVRAADSPYLWDEADWLPFTPGADLPGIRGRYVQIAADFYPSGDGETSPYLEELRVVYLPDEAPLPPPSLNAFARDGAVELSWKPSPDRDTAGYLVYYGVRGGEYFGEDAILGVSPINAGKRTSLRVEGLVNGRLYYFAVAAYDRENGQGSFHAGEFSREAAARPVPEPLPRFAAGP